MGSGLSDEAAMRHALRLALRGTGRVSPNPRVGCVILKDGRIIAEGWHAEYGGPHAEVMALERATEDVRGATLVVTLEPCVHQGKTPPCTPRIIERGIARVVIGMLDPNPQVNGRGVEQLRAAGIQVELGVLEADCFWLNRFFAKHVRTGMPYVVGKLAQSLDGCIALPDGESRWISSEESRRRVHALRAELDAVLVGKGTVFRDNPRLDGAQGPRTPALARSAGHAPATADDELCLHRRVPRPHHRVLLCPGSAPAQSRNTPQAGVQLLELPTDSDGRLHLPSLLRELSQRFQIASVLVEGGAGVMSAFLQQQLLDELHLFCAPIVLGKGRHPFEQLQVPSIQDAPRWHLQAVLRSGEDLQCILLREPLPQFRQQSAEATTVLA
jgi:diaminohydroxyphosphoribosylaminopyrimidine deaminase/5-amino-6-(5-phosphoribosylamino)uracil reductase